MSWARIMTPLAGEPGDGARLAAARIVSAPFGAEVSAVYVPLEAGAMTPWISDGVGVDAGVEVAALAAIGQANEQGRARARLTATAGRLCSSSISAKWQARAWSMRPACRTRWCSTPKRLAARGVCPIPFATF
jgi:hypothetical protein